MSKPENGGRIEWLTTKGAVQSESCYVWWRTPAEWADAIYGWVEDTGQRNSVLTVYEIREGEGKREWRGMEEGMLRKVLGVLVKRGKAQVFGQAEAANTLLNNGGEFSDFWRNAVLREALRANSKIVVYGTSHRARTIYPIQLVD
ncbi:uncharacterized protein LTR77_006795 [Saxophila tyrrhenica]|uniref:ESCRT-II complex subunit VPS25 n=1 Tax=Saxophila tyrrhenica TaxID=1690608 RepID=A0AAV9P9Z5_9PEZI|nr:hypothetical protein LTR77_006795 [Saxophila tyrrhenica]